MERSQLHNYQKNMVEFIKNTPHCALLAEMGVGKTIATLTAVVDLMDDLEISKVLVIAPKFVAQTTWSDECEKWSHLKHLRISRVMGTEKQRLKALDEEADIYVMGRDNLVWLVKHYKGRVPFDMAVLDELTTFKHPTSMRFKAFKIIRTQFSRIVGLTGTPAPNGYIDLFGQMFCIDGGERLGRYITHYRNNYFDVKMSWDGKYVKECDLKPGAKEVIDSKIAEVSIVMKADDYLEMPKRTDIVQYVELPEPLMKRYRKFEKDLVMQVGEAENITASSASALINKLSQFCNGAVYNDEHEALDIHTEKVEALKELYEQAGEHLLVFYRYRSDVNRIWEAFGKNQPGKPYVHQFNSPLDVRMWNEGQTDILLAHPASTAYGLNMQGGGSIVCWFGLGWDLELYQQANARLYRQGQTKPVRVYHLICKGTVEERALRVMQGKANGQEAMLQAVKELYNKYHG